MSRMISFDVELRGTDIEIQEIPISVTLALRHEFGSQVEVIVLNIMENME